MHNLLTSAPGYINLHFEILHYSYFGCNRKHCLLYKLPWLLAASPPCFYLKIEMVWDQMPDPRYLHLLEQHKALPHCSVFSWGGCSPTTHSSHAGTEFSWPSRNTKKRDPAFLQGPYLLMYLSGTAVWMGIRSKSLGSSLSKFVV